MAAARYHGTILTWLVLGYRGGAAHELKSMAFILMAQRSVASIISRARLWERW
jgi:hypothetical protein